MTSNSPKNNLIRGAAWTVGTRAAVKVLGFVNTVVMARLLMPEDYGLVAMAMLVVGLIQTMLEFGAVTALMRKEHLTQDDIDSAWTLKVIQAIGTGCLIAISPIIATEFLGENRISHILPILAILTTITGFSSLAPVVLSKSFDFTLAFKVDVCSKLNSVIFTIIGGIWLQDYRALLMGFTAGYLTPLILTYALHPMRHRLNTTKITEIWALTKWLMLANVGNFVLRKGDELAAAKIGPTNAYGNFNVGADLGSLPVAEVGPAVLRALLPVLSTIQSDIKRTNLAINKTMGALGTLIWPLGFGVLATAPQLTHIILGAKWHAAAEFVGLYGIIAVLQALATPLTTLLTLRTHTKIQSQLVWLEFATFAAFAFWQTPAHGLVALAWARLLASSMNLSLILCATSQLCGLKIYHLLPQLLRPFIGSALMAVVITKSPDPTNNIYINFTTEVLTGGLLYLAWSLTTWKLTGKPEGLESTIIDRISINRKRKISQNQ